MASSTPAPNERLPDSILLFIFQLYISGPAVIPPPRDDERAVLMAICRRWQRLIESSSGLWHDVVFLPVSSQSPAALRMLANTWLDRTRGIPLCINFDRDFAHSNKNRTATHTQQLMYGGGAISIVSSIILPCIDRITSLSCTLATNSIIRAFFNIPAGRFLALEHLDILLINRFDQSRSEFSPFELSAFTVFQMLPNLRDLTVHIFNGIHPFDLQLPFGQLVALHLGSTPIAPDVFLDIIDMCSFSLVDGCFQIKFTSPPRRHRSRRRYPAFDAVPAYTLQRLHLVLIDPSRNGRLFDPLQLPALIYLRIDLKDLRKGWDLNLYIPLLRKTPMLQFISLTFFSGRLGRASLRKKSKPHHRQISDQQMQDFLSVIPNIRSLHFAPGLHINSPTLEKMATGELLPLLEILELGSVSALHVLSMLQRKNDLAVYRASYPMAGNSSRIKASPDSGPLRLMTSLRLIVPCNEEDDVNDAAERLRRSHSCTQTNIVVEGLIPRLFYHLK